MHRRELRPNGASDVSVVESGNRQLPRDSMLISCAAIITPAAMSSLLAKMAVGGFGNVSS